MKKLNLFFALYFAVLTFAQAQVPPQAFNYSAVARNAGGQPIANSTIGIQISILKNSALGQLMYSENHFVNTDAFGLFNLVVGAGAVQSGSMSTINWSNDNYYLKVDMDANGGTNFLTMGTTQLLSVPYALHAATADSIIGGNVGFSGNYNDLTNLPNLSNINTDNQQLAVSATGDTLKLQNGGFVIIPGISVANTPPQLATLTTSAVSSITSTTAISGGEITNNGGVTITARGIVWSTNQNPTLSNNIGSTINGTGTGSFSSNLTGLTANTIYYIRAYATNSVGTVYGNQLVFATNAVLSTTVVSSITTTTAISGGNILNSGGANITARGIVWSIYPNPVIENNNNATNDGTGSGSFTSNLSTLSLYTRYYVRAYATNSSGTAYGNEVSFTTPAVSGSTDWLNSNLTYGSVNDIDGNTYKTIQIGTQTWMAENLRTTKYRNGDFIQNITDINQWSILTTGAWVYYNNDNQYESPYGKLYNWYSVNDARNICPTGWHVPSDAEWTVLTNFLGGLTVAAGKMKSTGTQYWLNPNQGATNESGFSGLPGGYLPEYSSPFYIGEWGLWWSSTEDFGSPLCRIIFNTSQVDFSPMNKTDGLSVRCIKD